MIYPPGQRRDWGRNGSVPDVSRMETKLWFYYQAASYIDVGHRGDSFRAGRDHESQTIATWPVGRSAGTCSAYGPNVHAVTWSSATATSPAAACSKDEKLLLDFHSFPLRIMEVPDKPAESDSESWLLGRIYGRSKGGLTFSGWQCDHLPYLVEIDNSAPAANPEKQGPAHLDLGLRRKSPGSAAERRISKSVAALRLGMVGKTDPPAICKCPAAARCDRHWMASAVLRQYQKRRDARRIQSRRDHPPNLGADKE